MEKELKKEKKRVSNRVEKGMCMFFFMFEMTIQDRDESSAADGSVKKRRGDEASDKQRSEKQNGSEEKRKSSSDRKR